MRRIVNHGYSPTQEEIRSVSQEVGLGQYCPDFISDIAAICEGSWEIEQNLTPKSCPEFTPDSDGDYTLSSGRYTQCLLEKEEDWKVDQTGKQKAIQDFLIENISLWENTPGQSPLHKAILAVKKLSEEDYTSQDGVTGNTLPVPSSKRQQQKVSESYSETLEVLEKLKPEDYEYLEVQEGDKAKAFAKMGAAEKLLFKVDQFLEGKTQLKVKPRSKLLLDPEGSISLFRQSRSISDLPKANKKVLMARNVGYSLLSGKGKVPVQYRRDTPVPLISLMVDNSGSMEENNKNHKAWGVIYHLAKKAARYETALILSSFVTSVSDVWYVPAGTEIKDTMGCLKLHFDGGGTKVGECAVEFLEKIQETIKEEGLNIDTSQNHLVIINDGQDDASSLTREKLGNSILHGLILESSNSHIESVCKKTGGLYLESV